MTVSPASAVLDPQTAVDDSAAILFRVRQIARSDLAPLVDVIDLQGRYPEQILRSFGAAGAYRTHLPEPATRSASLTTAINAMSVASEYCLSTGFCMWCQSALGWYLANSQNDGLQRRTLDDVAAANTLGGTGLSNPVKAFSGIERFRLRGRRVDGGYVVTGALPWVSNLGAEHTFATVFEIDGSSNHQVMALIGCRAAGVTLVASASFVALDATRTYSVQLRHVFVPFADVIADPAAEYVKTIRSGFILLQAGMGLGLIRNCIDLMRREGNGRNHINRYIRLQPDDLEQSLDGIAREIEELAEAPFETDTDYVRRVLNSRLRLGELTVEAAHFAMLHQGARGYVKSGHAQRRLREAYFVAIVTPATKHLQKLLSELPPS